VSAVTVLAGLVRFTRLGSQSYWEDEVVTVGLLHEHAWHMVRWGIPYSEDTPPLYYLVAWCWVRLFGSGEFALRSLSALAGTATVPVAYLAARTLATFRAALTAAFLVALSPILVWYSQEARSYSLFVLLSAASFLFFVRASKSGARGDVAGWAVASALALATHYFAGFLVALEALWLVRRLGLRRALVVGVIGVSLTELALVPLLLKQLSTGHADTLIRSASLGDRLGQLGAWFATGEWRSAAALAAVAVLAAAGLTLVVLLRRNGLPALGVGLGTIVLPVALTALGSDYLFFRNLIMAWVPLAVALAIGLSAGRAGMAAAAALCVLFLAADLEVFMRSSLQRDDWRSAAATVSRARGPTAVVVYPAWEFQPLSFYAPSLALSTRSIRVRTFWFVGVSSQFSGWKPPLALTLRIPSGFRQVSDRRFQHFVLRRYAAREATTLTAAELRPIVRGSNGRDIPHTAVLQG
jgi:mannosyltransferase